MKLVFEEKTPSGLTMPDEFELDPKGTPGFWTNQIRSLIHSMEKDNALKDFPYLLDSQLSKYPNVRKDIAAVFKYYLPKKDGD